MKIWRVGTETRTFGADDLSGKGSALYPGRWNDAGHSMVYCARSVSLAMLETTAHLNFSGLPLNRYLIEVRIPKPIWERRRVVAAADLPRTWDAIPAGRTSVQFGTQWLKDGRTALLCVPSAIVPEEQVVLINPRHGDAVKIVARSVRPVAYDRVIRNVD